MTMGSVVMKIGKAVGILISSSLLLTSAALAGGSSDKASRKGDHTPQKTAPVAAVRHVVKPQPPIVMGRSVSLHRKTKLHHVKVNPPESDENQL
jgi:hypothetical protein